MEAALEFVRYGMILVCCVSLAILTILFTTIVVFLTEFQNLFEKHKKKNQIESDCSHHGDLQDDCIDTYAYENYPPIASLPYHQETNNRKEVNYE